MEDKREFLVEGVITKLSIRNLSKVFWSQNYYAYLSIKVISSQNLQDESLSLAAEEISLQKSIDQRKFKLKKGDKVRLIVGVDKLEDPKHYYWLRSAE